MTTGLAQAAVWLLGIGFLATLALFDLLTAPVYLSTLAVLAGIFAMAIGGSDCDLPASELGFRTTCRERMKLGEWNRVLVRGGGPLAIALADDVELVRVSIRTSSTEFEVKELSSSDQTVSTVRETAWDFDLKPLRIGKRTIRVLKTILDAETRAAARDFESDDYNVLVQINLLYWLEGFVAKEWKYLVSAAGLALVALGWKARVIEFLSLS